MRSSLPSHSPRASSVRTRPGAIPFTRTVGASSNASCLVRCTTAALVTLYHPIIGSGPSPPIDAMLRIAPPCEESHWAHAALDQVTTLAWLISKVFCRRTSSISSSGPA